MNGRERARLLLADVRRSPFSEHYRREKDWRKLGDEYVAFLREEMKRPSEPEDLDSITDWLRKVQRQADGEDAGQAAWLVGEVGLCRAGGGGRRGPLGSFPEPST